MEQTQCCKEQQNEIQNIEKEIVHTKTLISVCFTVDNYQFSKRQITELKLF